MWDQTEEIIQAELSPGERLLWTGRPPLGLMLRASDAAMIPFHLLFGGIVLVMLSSMQFFSLLFVVIWLYLIFGRFFVDKWRRARTYYAVTSERVVVVFLRFGRTTKSLNLDTLTDVTLTERDTGAGIITFGPLALIFGSYPGSGLPGMGQYAFPIFELSSDARQVYEIIRDARREVVQRI